MAMIAGDIKEFLTIKIKPRDDNLYDQYSRIFMSKVLLVTSLVVGLSWYADKFNCIIPEKMMVSEDFPAFVGATCWIQGVYVYKELSKRNDDIAYFGITTDIELDGTIDGELCKTYKRPENIRNENCIPMKKTFYLQYQYMPFLLAAMAFLFYLPYIFHRIANDDLIKLKRETEKEEPDPSRIYRVYFKEKKGKPVEQKLVMYRQILILLVKVCYLLVNVGAFLIFDGILNGMFTDFGTKWFKWSSLSNIQQYEYTGSNEYTKPANEMLPPFGYCEVWSGAKDVRETHVNKHKVICELSQFVLYQYTFVLLWLLIVIGIIVAAIGFVYALVKMISGCCGIRVYGHHPETKKIYQRLTTRQMDYFEFLKQENLELYGEVMAMFSEDILSDQRNCQDASPHPEQWSKSPERRRLNETRPEFEL